MTDAMKKNIFAAAVLLVFFAIYLQVMPPSFNSDDSPETTLAFKTLGIQHPPGYPLATITGKIFMSLPFGSYMLRANIMAVIFNLVAALFMMLIILRLVSKERGPGIREYSAAVFAMGLYLFASTPWLQGIIAKGSIYALHAALTSCTVYLLLLSEKNRKYLYAASLIYGISFGNHMQSSVVMLPAFAAFVFFTSGKKLTARSLVFAGLFFVLGASVNLFVFVRSMTQPVYAWGDTRTIKDFLWLITRAQYAGMEVKHTVKDTMNLLSYHVNIYTFKEYLPFLGALILPGVFLMFRKMWKEAVLFVFAPLVLVLSVVMVATPPANTEWLIKPYLASSYIFSSVIIAYGVYVMSSKLNNMILVPVLAAVLTASAFINAPDYRRYFIGYDYMNNLKTSMPKGSVLMCEGDMNIGAALYGTLICGHDYTPFIPVVSQYEWYRKQVKRNYKDKIKLPQPAGDVKKDLEELVLINAAVNSYYTNVFTEPWVSGLFPQPRGVLNLVTNKPVRQVITDNPMKIYSFRGFYERQLKTDEFTVRLVAQNYANAYYRIADSLRTAGMNPQAVGFYKRGIYYQENDGAWVNLGLSYYALNMLAEAQDSWQKAIKANPKNSVAYSNMAFIFIAKDDVTTAVNYARQALALDPNNQTAAQLLNQMTGNKVNR